MGLLEAHTVVSAKAKLAGSTPSLREGEVDLRRREAGARQLPATTQETQDPPLLPSQEPGVESSPLSHRLRSTEGRVGYSKRKPLRQVLLPYVYVLHEEDRGIHTHGGRHVQTDRQQWQSLHAERAGRRDTSPGLRIQSQNHETPFLSLQGDLWCLFMDPRQLKQ